MGYILPVNFEQYNQYHLRGMHEESNPFRTSQIERTSRASLLQFADTSLGKEDFLFKKKEELHRKKIDEVYAELTGTGLRFNQKV